jgi:hypothetical protein
MQNIDSCGEITKHLMILYKLFNNRRILVSDAGWLIKSPKELNSRQFIATLVVLECQQLEASLICFIFSFKIPNQRGKWEGESAFSLVNEDIKL